MKSRFMIPFRAASLCICLCALSLWPLNLSAQEGPGSVEEELPLLTGSEIGDILLVDIGGFGGAFAGVGINFLMLGILGADGELGLADQMIGSAMTELSDIPLFISGSPDALGLSLGGAALWGLEALSNAGYGIYDRISNFIYWGKNDLTMYKAYDSYASLRLRSGAWDNSGFKRYGFMELMTAPLDYRLYAKPQPWIALAGGLGLTTLLAFTLASDPWADAVWTTGEWYVGDTRTNPAAFSLSYLSLNAVSSAYTGVGEEAVFRGFLHEELSTHLGKAWATVIDTSAFILMHFFTDLARGNGWSYIGAHMLFVGGSNVLFDWAYDEGGLPLAVTCHALVDFVAFGLNALFYGGSPSGRSGH